jgi:hypothetical protein
MEVVAGPEPQVFSPVPIGDLIREWIEVRELRLENERIAERSRRHETDQSGAEQSGKAREE